MKLFGTDGIRGEAGVPPLDPRTVARVGAALGQLYARPRRRVLIGRDTRESGPWIEEALAAGFCAQGADVVSAGVVPTPAVAYLTRAEGFDLGIVISASHNPFQDNGIKVFSGTGTKFSEADERAVEHLVADESWSHPGHGAAMARRPELIRRYEDHLRRILDAAGPLAGAPVVVDCANGATSVVAPAFFRAMGFDAYVIGASPDGRNINLGCGSTAMERLQAEVVTRGARLGVAFDGDGDRALFVDHQGRRVDGDAVMLLCAEQLQRDGQLTGGAVVATVMSNIGLELAFKARGITMIRCPVGDKYVMEEMMARGLSLGGEQSGHVIFADHLFTGDGMATALHVLRTMALTGRELADLAGALVTFPQVLVNVRIKERADIRAVPAVAEVIRAVEAHLEGHGRLLVRYSGTEPLLRIMLEGRDQGEIRAWAEDIADAVRTHLG